MRETNEKKVSKLENKIKELEAELKGASKTRAQAIKRKIEHTITKLKFYQSMVDASSEPEARKEE